MAFNFGGASGGAGAGSLIGGPWGAAIGGLLGGFLGGGGPQLPPELRRLYNLQYKIAKQLQGFAGSAPMSDPLERMGLAGEQAQLGEQQRLQREQAYAMLGPGAVAAPQDVAGSLASQQVGQRMALSSQHMLDALKARRAALPQAAGVAAQAAGATGGMKAQEPTNFAQMFGQLAQQYAQQQALRRGQQQQQRGGDQTNNVTGFSTQLRTPDILSGVRQRFGQDAGFEQRFGMPDMVGLLTKPRIGL